MDNLDEVERFVSFQSTLSRAPNTLKKYKARLATFNRFLGMPWRAATRDDISHALLAMQEAGYKPNTLRDERIIARMFYNWLFELPKGQFPTCVAWIEVGNEESKHVERDELITAEDLQRILDATGHIRNKAMIAVLWATGVRAEELLTLRIKDVETVEGILGLDVQGTKTEYSRRWVAIADVKVQELLNNWLQAHPSKANPSSFLWTNPDGKRICYRLLNNVLKDSHRNAGVFKPANPHHYRHTWATFTARKHWPYETFVRLGGWALNSKVPQRYLHNDKHDDANAVAASLENADDKRNYLLKETHKYLAEFISRPDTHSEWQAFLATKENAQQLNDIARSIAEKCYAPVDSSKKLPCSERIDSDAKPRRKRGKNM
jgi:integrase/recombinase XerD